MGKVRPENGPKSRLEMGKGMVPSLHTPFRVSCHILRGLKNHDHEMSKVDPPSLG